MDIITPKMVNLLCSLASSEGKPGNSGVLIFNPIKVIKSMASITPTNGPGAKGLKNNFRAEFDKSFKYSEILR